MDTNTLKFHHGLSACFSGGPIRVFHLLLDKALHGLTNAEGGENMGYLEKLKPPKLTCSGPTPMFNTFNGTFMCYEDCHHVVKRASWHKIITIPLRS